MSSRKEISQQLQNLARDLEGQPEYRELQGVILGVAGAVEARYERVLLQHMRPWIQQVLVTEKISKKREQLQ